MNGIVPRVLYSVGPVQRTVNPTFGWEYCGYEFFGFVVVRMEGMGFVQKGETAVVMTPSSSAAGDGKAGPMPREVGCAEFRAVMEELERERDRRC